MYKGKFALCSEQFAFFSNDRPIAYFVIISKMNGKVIDVKGGEDEAKLIAFERSDADNQIFYQDPDGIIHSKLNDYCMESRRMYSLKFRCH